MDGGVCRWGVPRKSRRRISLSEALRNFLFTSESVTEGHPDKIADQISDAVLDEVMRQDPLGRVACETLVTTGLAVVAGEVTRTAEVNYDERVRDRSRGVGCHRQAHLDCEDNSANPYDKEASAHFRCANIEHGLRHIVQARMLGAHTEYHANPPGRFGIGGPRGDAGVNGRKIIVQTSGGYSAH